MGRSIAVAVVAAVLSLTGALTAHAAGLGKLTVLSALGQPLNAEVEIVSLQPGEEQDLSARLASAEAFKQAGIDYNPAISGLRFAIERRGGRPLLKITTAQPVNEPFLDLLVELQWNTGRLVREYTFLLDPPEYKGPGAIAAAPAPAPAQPQAVPAAPAPAMPAEPAKPAPIEATPIPAAPAAEPAAPLASEPPGAAKTYEVKKGDTLGRIARDNLAPGATLDQMLIAIFRANQEAFIRDNINLVRAGRILNIPADVATTVDNEEARRIVRSHHSEFTAYRNRLAAAPVTADGSAGRREVAGRIEPKPPAPAEEKQDQLRLSKADPAKPSAPGARAAQEDDRVARERALKEAQSRQAELEKNVTDLQKLLALKNQQLAELEKKAAGATPAPAPAPAPKAAEAPKPAPAAPAPKAAEPAKPAPAPQPKAAEAAKPAPAPAPAPKAAEPAKPAAEAPKPAAKPAPKKAAPPPPEPSLVDEFLDNPLALGGLAGVILLLGGYGVWAWRRKKASQAKFQDSVLDAAAGAGPASVFGAAEASAPASQASVSQAPAGMEAEEVDPIAEADVYMAYGRDTQAEEILKEAIAKDANRVPVHAKLLEIYANRKDAKSFEQTAVKLKSLTNGAGPDWDKAVALGRSIDPQNGLYGGAAAAAPVAAAAAPAAPVLDFDLGGATTQPPQPDIALDTPTREPAAPASIDFDLGAAAASAPAGAEQKSDFTPEGTLIMGKDETSADKTGGGLDFDLGLGGDTKPVSASPSASAAPAETSGGLDFDINLDMGGESKPATGETSAPSMDLSSISLDLGSGDASAPSGGGDPKWQEVATKLDLAKAYEEMGDKDGARELLNEVMKDGDATQKGQAQQLLAKLG